MTLSRGSLFGVVAGRLLLAAVPAPAAEPVTHAFLATGGQTYIRNGDGTTAWKYPHASRDGWVLPNGNVLLALSKGKACPGGAAVEVTRDGKVVFEFKGTQSEVNTVQAVGDGRVLLTEAGNKPRLLEVVRDGKIAVEVPLKAQTKDHHLQTRMSRKLANGNYLVPQAARPRGPRVHAQRRGGVGGEDAAHAVHGDPPAGRQHAHRLHARQPGDRGGRGTARRCGG